MTKAYRPDDNNGWFREDHKAAKIYHGLGDSNLRPFLQEMMARGEHVDASTKDVLVRFANGKNDADGYELHGRFVDTLKHRREFVNVANDGFLRKYGITASHDKVKDAAEHIYSNLVLMHEREGFNRLESQAMVEKDAVRLGVTLKDDKPAVLVHPHYLAVIKKYINDEKKWSTAETASSPERGSSHGEGIAGRPETINLAMSYLFKREVDASVEHGNKIEQAVGFVGKNFIRLRQDDENPERVQWQVHDQYRPMVNALVQKLTLQNPAHREDSWYAAAKEGDAVNRKLAQQAWVKPVAFASLSTEKDAKVDADATWVDMVNARDKAAVALIVEEQFRQGVDFAQIKESVQLKGLDSPSPYWRIKQDMLEDVAIKLDAMPNTRFEPEIAQHHFDKLFKQTVIKWKKLEAVEHGK